MILLILIISSFVVVAAVGLDLAVTGLMDMLYPTNKTEPKQMYSKEDMDDVERFLGE